VRRFRLPPCRALRPPITNARKRVSLAEGGGAFGQAAKVHWGIAVSAIITKYKICN